MEQSVINELKTEELFERLEDEKGSSHQNIRNFMKTGFETLSFEGDALVLKS